VNVVPGVRSFYRWRGAVEDANEWLLIAKTSRSLFSQFAAALEQAHSYELPEVLALPVVEGSHNYLNWLTASVGPGDSE
jgi:periplasmic divalent cation tolerance protein